jgi:soluble lytic murein transglycosylase-like protein
MKRTLLAGLAIAGAVSNAGAQEATNRSGIDALVSLHAKTNGVPEDLVHRIIVRESRYNPRAVGRGGAMGLMQIKHGTARAMGYSGPASGLLDANTNLTYAVRYLAGAYRVAGNDHRRAVGFYARGYYYDAKRRGMLADAKPTIDSAPSLAASLSLASSPSLELKPLAAKASLAARSSRASKASPASVATPALAAGAATSVVAQQPAAKPSLFVAGPSPYIDRDAN